MRGRLYLAIVGSIALHLALLLAALWRIGEEPAPLPKNTLVVNLEIRNGAAAGADITASTPSESEQRSQTPPPQHTDSIIRPINSNTEPVTASALTTRGGINTVEVESTAPLNVVTVIRQDTVAITPFDFHAPPKRSAFSAKQTKMLTRKIKAWTERLPKLASDDSELTWKHKGQQYRAKFTPELAADDMGIPQMLVEISTELDGKRLSSTAQLKQLAFSSYAQFVDRWDPEVSVHNDVMDGRFHSNSEINLARSRDVKPAFHGMVTTTSRGINFTDWRGSKRRDQVFFGGLQTGVRSIRLPKHFRPFSGEPGDSSEQAHRFNEHTRIVFQTDGSYLAQGFDGGQLQRHLLSSDDTTYLIANEKTKLYVKGTVNGKVLVYSPERIIIEDDLMYADHPDEVPESDDYLGLVSGKYVDIAPPERTGPGDLRIDAAIYAKRRFTVRNYRHRGDALLQLFGSLSVGSLSATEPRYRTKIRFDPRFEDRRPPGFPMTDRYEIESWDRTWAVEPRG